MREEESERDWGKEGESREKETNGERREVKRGGDGGRGKRERGGERKFFSTSKSQRNMLQDCFH